MKKNEKVMLGIGVLIAVLLLSKDETAGSDYVAPTVEPESPPLTADLPTSVSGRFPLRNYKTA